MTIFEFTLRNSDDGSHRMLIPAGRILAVFDDGNGAVVVLANGVWYEMKETYKQVHDLWVDINDEIIPVRGDDE